MCPGLIQGDPVQGARMHRANDAHGIEFVKLACFFLLLLLLFFTHVVAYGPVRNVPRTGGWGPLLWRSEFFRYLFPFW